MMYGKPKKMAEGGMVKKQPAPAGKPAKGGPETSADMMKRLTAGTPKAAAMAKRPYGADAKRPVPMPAKPMGMAKGGMVKKGKK